MGCSDGPGFPTCMASPTARLNRPLGIVVVLPCQRCGRAAQSGASYRNELNASCRANLLGDSSLKSRLLTLRLSAHLERIFPSSRLNANCFRTVIGRLNRDLARDRQVAARFFANRTDCLQFDVRDGISFGIGTHSKLSLKTVRLIAATECFPYRKRRYNVDLEILSIVARSGRVWLAVPNLVGWL